METDRHKRRPNREVVKVENIAAWLRSSTVGRKTLEEAVGKACLNCERVRDLETRCMECGKRQRVLVVCGMTDDGRPWVNVYCGERVDAMICQQVTVCPSNESLAEELMELRLPLAYRELYVPIRLKRQHVIERRTVAELWNSRVAVELIRGVQKR
jgi:hypothetical protein